MRAEQSRVEQGPGARLLDHRGDSVLAPRPGLREPPICSPLIGPDPPGAAPHWLETTALKLGWSQAEGVFLGPEEARALARPAPARSDEESLTV